MKKIFIFSFIALCMGAMISCSSCKKDNKDAVNADLNVENVTNTDKQYMFTTYVFFFQIGLIQKILMVLWMEFQMFSK